MKKSIRLFFILSFFCTLSYTQRTTNRTARTHQEISFLKLPDSRTIPTKNSITTSLAALENDVLKPLHIATLTRAFAYSKSAAQDVLIVTIDSKNKALAETLLIFRNRLDQARADEKKMQQMVEVVFMHFITNTEGGISLKGNSNATELYEVLKRYAQSLGLELISDGNGQSIFKIAAKTVVCRNCNLTNFNSLRDAGITVNRMRYGRDDVIASTAFDFNGSAYTLENAAIMADFCNLTYFQPEFIKSQLIQKGFSFVRWIEGSKTDTEVLITQKDGYQIVCFRGTNSLTDVAIDLWFAKNSAYGGKGKVHAGFQTALNEVWTALEKNIDKNRKVIIAGHSLGGALAQLLAYRLSLNNYNVSGVYTYGSPRVGNSIYKEEYNARLAAKTYLHINNKDAVPSIPLEILGFIHLGTIERRFDTNHKITLINDKGHHVQPTKELRFDELDEHLQDDVRRQMQEISIAINASSEFLNTSPYSIPSMSYSTNFEEGKIDDHSIDQYLFKLACAIVDREMKRINK